MPENNLKIIDVIPITRMGSQDSLSYYSTLPLPTGSLVSVEVRHKKIPALVVGVRNAKDDRTLLRNQSFALKKIKAHKPAPFLTKPFMETLKCVADYYATSVGSVIHSVIPQTLLKSSEKLEQSKAPAIEKRHLDKRIFQANKEDRFSTFKGLVREAFAQNESIFFCFPSQDSITEAYTLLKKGVEDHAFMLHSDLSAKKLITNWNNAVTHEHPVVIFGTASFLHLPRPDIGTVVVERESSRFYKSPRRPYIDYRLFAEMYTETHGATLILSDSLLQVSTLQRYHQDEFIEYSNVRFKYITPVEKVLIDMREEDKHAKEFHTLSGQLKQLIDITVSEHSHTVILAPRRGLSPITVCSDCGTIVRCRNCSAPVTLHEKTTGNIFICHKCGDSRTAEERCTHCTSWNLTPLGIGIEKVEKEIRAHNKDVNLFRIDRDATPTRRSQKECVTNFFDTPGSILLGTEMLISRLTKKVPYSAIVSLDALFSLPEYSINEKILHIIMALQAQTITGSIIQTRDPDRSVFPTILEGNLNTFYRDEIDARKMLSYPPFSVFIKITASGVRENVEKEMSMLETLFSDVDIITFPAFHKKIKGKYSMHALMKIPTKQWPDKTIADRLRALPPYLAVNVGPESIL